MHYFLPLIVLFYHKPVLVSLAELCVAPDVTEVPAALFLDVLMLLVLGPLECSGACHLNYYCGMALGFSLRRLDRHILAAIYG